MEIKTKYILVLGALIISTYIGYKLLPKDEIVIQSNEEASSEIEKIYVHIEGCVHNPGVMEVLQGTRIYELIELAGGETEEADLSKVNLASVVKDEQKIVVPAKIIYEEETNKSNSNVKINSSNSKSMLVNLNTATKEELETLNGIGSSMAKRIIEYRETNGYFMSVEDIMNVSGIGEGKFEKIKDNIEV